MFPPGCFFPQPWRGRLWPRGGGDDGLLAGGGVWSQASGGVVGSGDGVRREVGFDLAGEPDEGALLVPGEALGRAEALVLVRAGVEGIVRGASEAMAWLIWTVRKLFEGVATCVCTLTRCPGRRCRRAVLWARPMTLPAFLVFFSWVELGNWVRGGLG